VKEQGGVIRATQQHEHGCLPRKASQRARALVRGHVREVGIDDCDPGLEPLGSKLAQCSFAAGVRTCKAKAICAEDKVD
jgi:hypothetical protein